MTQAKSQAKRTPRAKPPAATEPKATPEIPVEPGDAVPDIVVEARPVEYPPRSGETSRPDIVVPDAEPEVTAEPEPVFPLGRFVVTDRHSYGPVNIADGRVKKLVKGTLYPFEDSADMGRLLSKGVLREATDTDKLNAQIIESGPGGPVTLATLAGIGVKKQ